MRNILLLLLVLISFLPSIASREVGITPICRDVPIYEDKPKWETNPKVIFDKEFERYPGLAEYAINEINLMLGSIQLIPDYSYSQDFMTYSTYWKLYRGDIDSYNRIWSNIERDNPNSIIVMIDDNKSGFGAAFSPTYAKVSLDGERFAEMGHDKRSTVLPHELGHAVNIRHQLKIASNTSLVGRYSVPLMDPYIRSSYFGVTNVDKNAFFRLYGLPCNDTSHVVNVKFSFDTNSLAAAFIPTKKKIKRLISRDFGKFLRRKYTSRLIERGVISGIKNNEMQYYLPSGKYIIRVSGVAGWEPDDTFRPDIEGGTPSLSEVHYVRYRPRYKDYVLTTDIKKASKIKIEEDLDIVIGEVE